MRKLGVIMLAAILVATVPIIRSVFAFDESGAGHCCETYFEIYDEANPDQLVFGTGMAVSVGDQYQAEDDRLFEVVSVDAQSRRGIARFLQKVELEMTDSLAFIMASIDAGIAQAQVQQQNITVGVYQSHTDESYVPTSGADSKRGTGDILKVGAALTQSLKQAGVNAVYSDKKHDPHDSGAYRRSRRTAEELLKKRPTALLDVHRDAGGTADIYTSNIKGNRVAQIRLVVGRQNPNMNANKQFAQEIKATTDKQYPGLIKGIFFARGGYNQDMHPRNLLLEVGNEKVSLKNAQDGASIFAKAYANYLGARGAASQAGRVREGQAGSSALGWLVGLVLVGAAAFLLISTGGWNEMSSKLRKFATKEFANALGSAKRSRKDRDNHER